MNMRLCIQLQNITAIVKLALKKKKIARSILVRMKVLTGMIYNCRMYKKYYEVAF